MELLFWNVQHYSDKAEEKANAQEVKLEQVKLALENCRIRRGTTTRITRTGSANFRKTGIRARNLKSMASTREKKNVSRDVAAELVAQKNLVSATRKYNQLRRKAQLPEDLIRQFENVFFCEIESSVSASHNPLSRRIPPGNRTNCYAYFKSGNSQNFNAPDPVGEREIPDSFKGNHEALRLPKCVDLAVGKETVRFCFWHAPSGKKGREVADVFEIMLRKLRTEKIRQGERPIKFVLFGDLNATPADLKKQLEAKSISTSCICAPDKGTRISGKILDYALASGVKCDISPFRSVPNRAILESVGSDHMAMIMKVRIAS
ncbi:MAG: hypothetical protein NTW20_07165 [Rhodobacterales bacterium]|nr:hypothetical protein [Rhodobacterales bacterium]